MSKTTLHVQHAFLYISLSSLHDYDVQMPNYSFYRGHKEVTTKFYFAFWNWIWFLGIQHWESSPTFDKVSEFLYSRWRLQKREFTFYATFLPLSSSTNLKVAFYRKREHKTDEFHFLFLNLDIFRKTSTPGEFAYFRQNEHVGIIALKFQRTRIHFLCDVFAAALFSNFEVPISWHLKYRKPPLISHWHKHRRKRF